MNTRLTPKITVDFWAYMCERYKIKIVKKDSSKFAAFLRLFTGMNKETWSRYSTLIGCKLYTNIVPGVAGDNSLLGQVALITHECQHRIQDDNEFAYPLRYLLSRRYRAQKEVRAYTCNMEIYKELTGSMIPVHAIIENLENYKLRKKDLRYAEKRLSFNYDHVLLRGPITRAGKAAVAWFTKYQIENKISIREADKKTGRDFRRALV